MPSSQMPSSSNALRAEYPPAEYPPAEYPPAECPAAGRPPAEYSPTECLSPAPALSIVTRFQAHYLIYEFLYPSLGFFAKTTKLSG